VAAPRLPAACRVAADDQCPTVLSEITGIGCLFKNLPLTGQAYAVWMDEAPEALAIGTPPQIGSRVDGSRHRLPKKVRRPERQNPPQESRQVHTIDRQLRLVAAAPHLLIRVREQGVAHLGEA
jgi:hypothetical protein